MNNLGFQEIMLILVIALIVLGPNRLPEVARQAGRALATFRRVTRENLDEIKQMAEVQELRDELRQVRAELRDANPVPKVPRVPSKGQMARSALSSGQRPAGNGQPPVDPDAT